MRGKTMRNKTKLADPVAGKIVNLNQVMEADIMLADKLPLIMSVSDRLLL
jgi:hypothetical protein